MDDKKETTATEDEGNESGTDEKVKQLNAETEGIEKAIAEKANAEARAKLAGVAEAGITPVKQEETDEDIANKFDKGELDLLAQ